MNKDQMEEFLNDTLKLDDEELKKNIVSYILNKSFQEDYQNWEQLRFVKGAVDQLWSAIKKWSEREIVAERISQLIGSFPKPTKKEQPSHQQKKPSQ